MTNPYYSAGTFAAHTTARASAVQNEFSEIEAGFETLHGDLNNWGTAASTSSITIGTGTKTLTITTARFIQTGQNVIISSVATPTKWMLGQVTAWDGATGVASVEVGGISATGSGETYANWNVSVTPLGEATMIDGLPGVQTVSDVRTGLAISNVDNTSDANKPVSTAQQTAIDLKANIASPTLTGTPAAPTAASGTSSTQIATTAFVQGERAWVNLGTSATTSGTSVTFSNISQIYGELCLQFIGVSANGAGGLTVEISTNGSSWSGVYNAVALTGAADVANGAFAFIDYCANVGVVVGGAKLATASPVIAASSGTPPDLWLCTGGIKHIRVGISGGAVFDAGSVDLRAR